MNSRRVESSDTLRIVEVIDGTTVDGPGFRTSIYFAGCEHHCEDCHNPATWPMDAGYDISSSDLLSRIKENDMDVTLSGGDPLYQAKKLLPFLKSIRESGFSIWCYTGFTYESIAERPDIKPLLELIDVLVDGPFIKKLRDTALLFRGSSNQRLIDLRKSSPDNIVLWTPDF